uniref:RNA polymerase subunit beta n=1 Tax=Prototheca miyajii TaxID=2034260 RepID=UPI003001AC69
MNIIYNKKLSLNLLKKSIELQLKKNSLFFNDILNPLLYFYLKAINKKKKTNIIAKVPNLLKTQQLSFKHFLKVDIISALEIENPIHIKNIFYSFKIYFFSKYIQIKKPINVLNQAIKLNETYGCSIYVPILMKTNNNPEAVINWINLGLFPFITKSGHFIINGIPRVAMNQLVRPPGVYKLFNNTVTTQGIQKLPEVRVVPDKGGWITINCDSNWRLWITTKIFTTKVSYLVFLQALGFEVNSIFKHIQHSEILYLSIVPSLTTTNKENWTRHDVILMNAGLSSHPRTSLEACRYLHAHYLEYNSPIEKQRQKITDEKAFLFFWQIAWNSENKYLGHLGRSQFIKKLNVPFSYHNLQLTNQDFFVLTQKTINFMLGYELEDDIDNLNNKKVNSCGDFLYQELTNAIKDFKLLLESKFSDLGAKILKKSKKNREFFYDPIISEIIVNNFWKKYKNSLANSVTTTLQDFFVGGTLSQYLDETNPLSEITHKRRITLLGPGGVTSQQASIQIRSIHPTYYGRFCPIETPEGENAGLVLSFTIFAQKTYNGKIITPYYKVFKGQVQTYDNVLLLNSEDELSHVLIPADLMISKWKCLPVIKLPVRRFSNFDYTVLNEITAQAISSLQMISLATSLIPFLEHDDANRALMGSNMQRQAVALISPEAALVKTGLEARVIADLGHILQTQKSGFITQVLSDSVQVYQPKKIEYSLFVRKFLTFSKLKCIKYNTILSSTNLYFFIEFFYVLRKTQRNFFHLNINFKNANPFFYSHERLKFSLFDKKKYNIALEKLQSMFSNPLLTQSNIKNNRKFFYISRKYNTNYKTYNFEIFKRTNQSICTIQRPHVREKNWVKTSDIITDGGASLKGNLAIGKNVFVAYLPWEGYNFEDAVLISENLVSNDVFTSLHVDFYQTEIEKTETGLEKITKDLPVKSKKEIARLLKLDSRGIVKKGAWVKEGDFLVGKICSTELKGISALYEKFYNVAVLKKKKPPIKNTSFRVPKGVEGIVVDVEILPPKNTDFLSLVPENSILSVRISLLQRRKIQVGDKVAGRHGNKGVVSKILSSRDMPYLPDGTPIDIVLNPLGIPSRMNVGQILECLLGLAGKYLKESFYVNLFDETFGIEASRSFVYSKLYKASLKTKKSWLFNPQHPGKIKIFDGRTGIAFEQPVTVGYTYILKLIHMVDDKIHARATGPYSVLTQQPVKGRALRGGQRLGEMEVWALQAYGAAYTLQELLTLKSDDIDGRNSVALRIISNKPVIIKRPESIKLLLREIQALCINLEFYNSSSISKKLSLMDLNDIDKQIL